MCSKVFSGNWLSHVEVRFSCETHETGPTEKEVVAGNYEFYSHGEKEEVVGNLKLRATSKMIPRCSSEVSWLAEVFSVISSARLGWDDMSWVCNIQFRNTTIYCTISDWWRSVQNCFEDFSLSTCEHAEFYNVLSRYCSPKGRVSTTASFAGGLVELQRLLPALFGSMQVLQCTGDATIGYDDATYEFLRIIIILI